MLKEQSQPTMGQSGMPGTAGPNNQQRPGVNQGQNQGQNQAANQNRPQQGPGGQPQMMPQFKSEKDLSLFKSAKKLLQMTPFIKFSGSAMARN